jgi:hypothetical protein
MSRIAAQSATLWQPQAAPMEDYGLIVRRLDVRVLGPKAPIAEERAYKAAYQRARARCVTIVSANPDLRRTAKSEKQEIDLGKRVRRN